MRESAFHQYEILPLKLWSPLRRLLAASGQTKGSPAQWLGVVRNLQNKGVSAAEIEWSEIESFLELHPRPTLHIDELLAFLADAPPCELVLQRQITNEFEPVVRYIKKAFPAKPPPESIRHGHREFRILNFEDRSFGLCIWIHVQVEPDIFGRHRYWSLTVSHGRKHLPSFKNDKEFSTAQEAMAYGRMLVKAMAHRFVAKGFVGPEKSLNHFSRYALPSGNQYTEWLITAPNLTDAYWGEHFDIRNLIAHVRTSERTTPEGTRLLVLEEIQSDWNQALRQEMLDEKERRLFDDNYVPDVVGSADMLPVNPYLHHWLDAALRMMLLLAAHQGFAAIAWLPGQLHAERFHRANAKGLKGFYDQIVPTAVEKLAKSWGAKLCEAQFTTLSRRFGVRQLKQGPQWRVINLESSHVLDEVFSDQDKAEDFRRAQETSVLETVTCLSLSPEMRADIRENGLPYLGAVGKRLADRTPHDLHAVTSDQRAIFTKQI